jgi:hypothetical protein
MLTLCPGLLLGFILPGYGLSKYLRSPSLWVSSFVLSMVILFQILFWFGILGIPLKSLTIFPALIVVSTLGLWLGKNESREWRSPWAELKKERFYLFLIAVMILLMMVRSTMQPLSGYDTYFRWDFLALEIFETKSFSYYPALTTQDYKHYGFVDSIPPLVSFNYFWLYESFQAYNPYLTAILVSAQYLCILILIFRITRLISSTQSAVLALVVYVSCPGSFVATAMGQETGLTALSVLATLYFLMSAKSSERGYRSMILAGAATAMGMLSREYGGIVVVCGGVVVSWRALGNRKLLAYVLVSFALAGPWYLRTWILSGNPFYSIVTFGIFTGHERYLTMANWTSARNDFFTRAGILTAVPYVFGLAPLAFCFGFWAPLKTRRQHGYLVVATAMLFAVWLMSISATYSWQYSTRLLNPVYGLLSIGAGITLKRVSTQFLRHFVAPLMFLAVAFAFIQVMTFPFPASQLTLQNFSKCIRHMDYGYFSYINLDIRRELIAFLPRVQPAGTRTLAGDYLYAMLSREGLEVVSDYSPEVDFLFDKNYDPVQCRQKLEQAKIDVVVSLSNFFGTMKPEEKYPASFYAREICHWKKVELKSGIVIFLRPQR